MSLTFVDPQMLDVTGERDAPCDAIVGRNGRTAVWSDRPGGPVSRRQSARRVPGTRPQPTPSDVGKARSASVATSSRQATRGQEPPIFLAWAIEAAHMIMFPTRQRFPWTMLRSRATAAEQGAPSVREVDGAGSSAGRSPHPPFGRALLAEGRDALLDVVGGEGQCQLGPQRREGVSQGHVTGGVDGVCAELHKEG